ncbi:MULTISPECIES: thioredoxin family protein [Sphingobacterium]|uniref:thioredoxin family protein n=1 Tax=Sphingobacterium TaxID=28453 RepID=UPI0013DA0E30|nr:MULTISPECIES: thioredoxin family protein [unclassified Sphingobacterium]
MKNILLLIMLLLSSVASKAQGIVFKDNQKWDEVLAIADKENKLIFIDCYTEWCGPCKGLERNIFPQKEMGDFYNEHFINVKYDMEKENGLELDAFFPEQIKRYPTLLYVDPKSKRIVHKLIGTRSVDEFVQEAKKAIKGVGIVTQKIKYEDGNRELPFLTEYVKSLNNILDKEGVVKVIDDYLTVNGYDQLLQEPVWAMVAPYMYDYESKYLRYVLDNKSKFSRLKFVDQNNLDGQLTNTIGLTISRMIQLPTDLTTMETTFDAQEDTFNKLKKDINLFSRNQIFQEFSSKLYIYEQLMNRNWEEAYNAVTYAQKFGFKYTDRLKLAMSNYIIQESKDKKMLVRILGDLELAQQNGQKQFTSFNYYPYMRRAAEKLGRHKVAKDFNNKAKEIQSKKSSAKK